MIRVLVVDDSAFIRKAVSQMLSRSPLVDVVGTARDGEEALEQVERHRPDVVTLDLMMPRMNGVEFLRRQMERRPVPVVVCSIAHESGEMAMEAFDAGAVEFVQKPTALATDRVQEIAEELVAKVKAAAGVTISRVQAVPMADARGLAERAARKVNGPASISPTGRTDVVVIGISTGGPQALRYLIPRLPSNFPVPIAMVLHMPIGYTEMYAQRLNEISSLQVTEARDGDLLRPGIVFLAPAGRHLTFVRQPDGTVRTHLDVRPIDTQHRPSVDVLFRSGSEVFGSHVLGVVMTGMGNDGVLGAAHIKAQGGRIITEAEASCVVYGMPRAVAEASLSDVTASLDEMPDVLTAML